MKKEKKVCRTNEEFWEEVQKYWDYEKNEKHWSEYSYSSGKKIYLKCLDKDYHGNYEASCSNFSKGTRCPYCANQKVHRNDSFAEYHIFHTDKDFINKYLDIEKTKINIWETSPSSGHKIWVKCQEKGYHNSYEVKCADFTNGNRCPYCKGKKVSPLDSFAQHHIDNTDPLFLEKYWDYKSNSKLGINSWEIPPHSIKKVYIFCQEKDYHGSYEIICDNFTNGGRCSYCHNFKVHPLDSFAQWGIDNICEDFIEKYWSNKNIVNPWKIAKCSNLKVFIKCQDKVYHDNYEVMCNAFVSGHRCSYCWGNLVHPYDSFAQYWIDKLGQDFLINYWDYNKNKINPYSIFPNSNQKVWIKCQEHEHHGSYPIRCNHFYKGNRCGYCASKIVHPKDSFAQNNIDNICADFLEKYWDYEKNNAIGIDPWKLSTMSDKFIWIKCQDKEYHGSYQIQTKCFTNGNRCGYCNNMKVHPLDSVAEKYPYILSIWSDKNEKSPFEYSSGSDKKAWFKCSNEEHEDYYKQIGSAVSSDFRCPSCSRERTESILQEKVRLYLESLDYTILHERNCTLKCVNPKTKYQLPYDNEVVELKLIIETHGKQHYEKPTKNSSWLKKNVNASDTLHTIKLYDRYKRIFAKQQGFFYLEIPYWTDDIEETWKKLICATVNEILTIQKIA